MSIQFSNKGNDNNITRNREKLLHAVIRKGQGTLGQKIRSRQDHLHGKTTNYKQALETGTNACTTEADTHFYKTTASFPKLPESDKNNANGTKIKYINQWVKDIPPQSAKKLTSPSKRPKTLKAEKKLMAIAKIYQPEKPVKNKGIGHKPKLCHCYACTHKRTKQRIQIDAGTLPTIRDTPKDSKKLEENPQLVLTPNTDIVEEEFKDRSSTGATRSREQHDHLHQMEGKVEPKKRTLEEVLECIKKYANEDKKASNYRKRLRFVITQKRIYVSKTSHKRDQYEPDKQKVSKGMRRCASYSSFISQPYYEVPKPSVVVEEKIELSKEVLGSIVFSKEVLEPPAIKRELVENNPAESLQELERSQVTPPQPPEKEPEVVPVVITRVEPKPPQKRPISKRLQKTKYKENAKVGGSATKQKIQSALVSTSLYSDSPKIKIVCAYYPRVRTRELVKQMKSNFCYEPTKEFTENYIFLPKSLNRVIDYVEEKTAKDTLLRSPYFAKLIFLQLKQIHIHNKEHFAAKEREYQNERKEELQTMFELANEDRLDEPNFGLNPYNQIDNKKNIREKWYIGFFEQNDVNEDEVYMERPAASVLKYDDRELRSEDFVKVVPNVDGLSGIPNKKPVRKASVSNVIIKLEGMEKKIKELDPEDFSSASEDEDFKKSISGFACFSKSRRQTLGVDPNLVPPGSFDMELRVHELITGEAISAENKEFDEQIMSQRSKKLACTFREKLKGSLKHNSSLELKTIVANLNAAKLDLPVLLQKKQHQSSALSHLRELYFRKIMLIEEYNIENEIHDSFGGESKVRPEIDMHQTGLSAYKDKDKTNSQLKEKLNKVHMDTFVDFVDSEQYNVEMMQMMKQNFCAQGLGEVITNSSTDVNNAEYMVNTERVCYPMIFEQAGASIAQYESAEEVCRKMDYTTFDNLDESALHESSFSVAGLIEKIRGNHMKKKEQTKDEFKLPYRGTSTKMANVIRNTMKVHMKIEHTKVPGVLESASSSNEASSFLNRTGEVPLPTELESDKFKIGISPITKVRNDEKLSPVISPVRMKGQKEEVFSLTPKCMDDRSFAEPSDEFLFSKDKLHDVTKKYATLTTSQFATERKQKSTFREKAKRKIVLKFTRKDSMEKSPTSSAQTLKKSYTLKNLTLPHFDIPKPLPEVKKEVDEEDPPEKTKRRVLMYKKPPQQLKEPVKPEGLLFNAINRGQQYEVEALISSYPNVKLNVKKPDGSTMLHEAVKIGTVGIVEGLLRAGAEVDAQDNEGNTAAHYATSYGYNKVLDILLAYGASNTIWEGAFNERKNKLI